MLCNIFNNVSKIAKPQTLYSGTKWSHTFGELLATANIAFFIKIDKLIHRLSYYQKSDKNEKRPDTP